MILFIGIVSFIVVFVVEGIIRVVKKVIFWGGFGMLGVMDFD